MKNRSPLRRRLKSSLLAGLAASCVLSANSASRGDGFDLSKGWGILDRFGWVDGLDLVMDEGGAATGEVTARLNLGPLRLTALHQEHLARLNIADGQSDGEDETANRVTRQSRLGMSGSFGVAEGVTLPLGLSGEYRQRQSGQQDLDVAVDGGLTFPHLRIGTRLSIDQGFAADGETTQTIGGGLSFGFDWMGGDHQGRIDYGILPDRQITELAFGSRWPMNDGIGATIDVTHKPASALSEASVGLDQRFGPFLIGSDLSADSAGGYAIGFTLSLDLGPAPAVQEWRLSSLLANLQRSRSNTAVRDSFGIPAVGDLP
ncbi:hypothetical protein [Pelagibius sp.]|uniref:hypothetical protein n=1 Tax=Pelagibius sp. TaxID=1931238 RepID=UPI003BAF5E39